MSGCLFPLPTWHDASCHSLSNFCFAILIFCFVLFRCFVGGLYTMQCSCQSSANARAAWWLRLLWGVDYIFFFVCWGDWACVCVQNTDRCYPVTKFVVLIYNSAIPEQRHTDQKKEKEKELSSSPASALPRSKASYFIRQCVWLKQVLHITNTLTNTRTWLGLAAGSWILHQPWFFTTRTGHLEWCTQ